MKLGEFAVTSVVESKAATSKEGGTYGGIDSFSVLANLFECQVLVLDKANPTHADLYVGNKKGSQHRYLMKDARELLAVAASKEESLITIEFNGAHGGRGGHFAGHLPVTGLEPELPCWLAKAVKGK